MKTAPDAVVAAASVNLIKMDLNLHEIRPKCENNAALLAKLQDAITAVCDANMRLIHLAIALEDVENAKPTRNTRKTTNKNA